LQVLRSQHSRTFDQSAIIRNDSVKLLDKHPGISCAPLGRMIAKHFKELRAWQTAQAFKLSLYKLLEVGPYITESVRADHVDRSNEVLKEVGGLLDYLQSPEANPPSSSSPHSPWPWSPAS
jgi:hypothetical protein